MLFIDSREKANIKTLVASVVTPSHVMALSCADFLLYDKDGHSLGIERKTAADLLSSLGATMANGNHRIDDQLDRMAEAYTHRLLVVEGWPEFNRITRKVSTPSRETGWYHSSLQMRVWSLLTTTDTSMLPTGDKWATADLLRTLHNRSLKGCCLPSALRVQLDEEIAA